MGKPILTTWEEELAAMKLIVQTLAALSPAGSLRVLAAVAFLLGHDELGQATLREAQRLGRGDE